MQRLKQRLLETNDFAECTALDKYCELVVVSRTQESFSSKTQEHHILPRAWYKLHNKKLDNSANNVIRMLVSDHAKAHLFLFQAATNPEVKAQNAAAVRYMCNIFSEELIDIAADELNQIDLAVSKAKSKALAARRTQGLNERRRAVVCIETGQEFKTIKEAQDTMSIWIKQHLKGLAENAGGYHFKYVTGKTPKYIPKIARFSAEEVLVLKTKYPTLGPQIPELLVHHSAETIRRKAWELRIK